MSANGEGGGGEPETRATVGSAANGKEKELRQAPAAQKTLRQRLTSKEPDGLRAALVAVGA